MKDLRPAIILPAIICVAVGILLRLDSRTPSRETQVAASLAAAPPFPENQTPRHDPTAPPSIAGEVTGPATPLTTSSDNVAGESTRHVAIHVTGLKNQSSNLCVAVFDSAEGFPKPEHSRATMTIPVTADALQFSLSLPGSAATGIAVFQDLNGDGKLTKNSFGLPIEPYGFSNNARPLFGPPSFSQAAFRVGEATTTLEISVR